MTTTQTADNHNTDLDAELTQSIVVNIKPSGMIAVSGEDALRFLQGQTTCDVRDITATVSTLGAFCTPKGRVFANFRAVKIGDAFYLQMNESIVESTRLTLDKYIRFFKATMTNESNQWIRLGVAGKEAEIILRKMFGNIPSTINAITEITSGVIINLSGETPRFEIWLHDEITANDTWRLLSSELKVASPSVWDLLTIRAGIAFISPETVEAFTPHMINYQAVGGVSFTKGCYTGQEIVARTHYLGKLKKHLYRARVQLASLPVPGSPVTANGQHIGDVVNAVTAKQNVVELLAVIQEQSVLEGGLMLLENPLEILDLPYSLEEEK